MTLLRTCTNCNWDFPLTYTSHKCKFCKQQFDKLICSRCHEIKDPSDFCFTQGKYKTMCNVCNNETSKASYRKNPGIYQRKQERFRAKRYEEAKVKYEHFTKAIKDMKPMSEQDWLDACRYFGGCAICGSENIETRQYLINFSDGGRYTPGNIFPMCGTCATHTRYLKNPFVWADKHLGVAYKLGLTDERFQRMIDYLLDKAGVDDSIIGDGN